MWRVAQLKKLNQLLGNGEKNLVCYQNFGERSRFHVLEFVGKGMSMGVDISWSLVSEGSSGVTS